MKRLVCVLLALVMVLGLAGCGETSGNDTSTTLYAPEIVRAADYGFLPENMPKDIEAQISYTDFVTMLDKLLALYGVDGSDIWQEVRQIAEDPTIIINRSEGSLLLYYAAREVGLHQNITSYNLDNNWKLSGPEFNFWEGFSEEQPHIPNTTDPYVDQVTGEVFPGMNMINATALFVQQRASAVDGSMLLELDEGRSFRFGNPMTWDDAIKGVVRLYESDWNVARKVDIRDLLTEEGLAYFEQANARREELLNTPTEVTVTGTSYYVANDGDDHNDGLSPDTPWATVNRVNECRLQPGDAVFFKRGDIWREDSLVTREGTTYSAYGEGAKPIFTSSPEDGADPTKWELFYEDETGKKIWKFHRDVTDCGNLFFNDGNDWGYKRTGHWRWGKWVDNDNNDLDMIALLDRDLAFFCDCNSALPKTNTIEPVTFYKLYTTGPVYLRCDAGNPGEVFSVIEFGAHAKGFSREIIRMHNGVTLDNLAIRYTANSGLSFCDAGGTVQNCEIGNCAGNIRIDNYETEWSHGLESVTCGGGGFSFFGDSNTISNCYIHDTYQESLAIERNDISNNNLVIRGNLFERTLNILLSHLGEVTDEPYLTNSTFEDNIAIMSGYNWGTTQRSMDNRYGGGLWTEDEFVFDQVAFRNNVFIGAYGYLLHLYNPADGSNTPIMEGNIFCSFTPDAVGYYKRDDANGYYRQYPMKLSAEALAKDVGNDTNKFVILEQKQGMLQ